MKLPVFTVVLCCVFAGGAAASSYSEFNAGIASYKRKDFDAARHHMDAALAAPDLNPAFRAPAHYIRGETYAVSKQPQKAVEDFSQAIAADPLYLDALQARCLAYVQMNQLDAAVGDISALIRATPSSIAAYDERAALYLVQNKFDLAIADLTTVIGIAPDSVFSYVLRGGAYRLHGDTAKAMDDIDKAVDLAPHTSVPYYERGLIHEQQGDYERARADYADSAKYVHGDNELTTHIALVAWKSGDFANAAKSFQIVRDAGDAKYSPFAALWVVIASASAGNVDTANAIPATLDRSKWPGPLLDLYAGTSSLDAVLKAATIGDAKTQASQICEANFYGGEWNLLHHNNDAAKTELSTAASTCPVEFIEHDTAAVALRRLQ